MPFPFVLSLLTVCTVLLCAPPALAADLGARHSRVGALFAEPSPRAVHVEVYEYHQPVFVGTALKVPGYYGRLIDFEYRNYYGTSPLDDLRPPALCLRVRRGVLTG